MTRHPVALHRDPAVRLLLDRTALHDLMMRYAAGVDRRDFDLVASCFAPDFKGHFAGRQWSSRGALIDFIRGVSYFHTTMHMMGNQFIEVDGDEACMESYAMLTHHATRKSGDPFRLNTSGNRYVERLARRDGEWVIVERGGEPRWAPVGVTAVASDDAAVRWLLDRAEIHDLMLRYALGIDLRDYDRVRSCFAQAFRARYGARELRDPGELVAFIRGVERFASTTHFLGNQLIELDGSRERAALETYAMITHRERVGEGEPEDAKEWMARTVYVDALVRQAGRWRIAERGEQAGRVLHGRAGVPDSDDPAIAWLLDRAAIHDLVVATSFALDRRDWDLLRSCLALDSGDPEAFVVETRRQVERWHETMHFLGNQLIAIDGDRADVETYAYITRRASRDGAVSPWSEGARRFVDSVVREPGGWRIAARRIETNEVGSRLRPRAPDGGT